MSIEESNMDFSLQGDFSELDNNKPKSDPTDFGLEGDIEEEVVRARFLEEAVSVPGSQSPVSGVGGYMLGGTADSQAYIDRFVKQYLEANPDEGSFLSASGLFDPISSQEDIIKRKILRGDIEPEGFDYKIYDELASKGDVPAFKEQKRLEEMIRKDPSLGPRFESGPAPLTMGQRFSYASLDTPAEKEAFFSENFPDGEFFIKRVGQSFEDPQESVYAELFSTEPGGPLYQVDRFDYANTFTGRGLAKLFAKTMKAFKGDPKAKEEVGEIYREFGLDVVDVAAEFGNFQNLFPALVEATPTGRGLAITARGALGGVKMGASYLGDQLGQWLDKQTSLDQLTEEGEEVTTDTVESLMAAAFTGLATPVSSFLSFLGGNKQPLKNMFLMASTPEQAAMLQSAKNVGAPITVSNLMNSGVLKRLIAQTSALNPEYFEPVRQQQSSALFNFLKNKIEEGGRIETVTPNQLGQVLKDLGQNMRQAIMGRGPTDPVDDLINARVQADLASKELLELDRFDKRIRDDIYRYAFDESPAVRNHVFNLNLDNLRTQAARAQEQIRGEFTASVDKVTPGGELFDEFGNKVPATTETVEVIGKETIGGGLSPSVAKIADQLERWVGKNPVAESSGEVSSVLKQIDEFRKQLAEQVDTTATDNKYIQNMQVALNDVYDQAVKQVSVIDPTVGSALTNAKYISDYLINNRRIGYIGEALRNGNTRPFESLINPILSGEKLLGPDDWYALRSLVNAAPMNIPRKYLSGPNGNPIAPEVIARMNRAQRKELTDRFAARLQDSATLALQAEPAKFPAKLKQMVGGDLDLYDEDAVLNNPNFKFFFPRKETRREMLKTAQVLERFQQTVKPSYDALADEPVTFFLSKEEGRGVGETLSDLGREEVARTVEQSRNLVKRMVNNLQDQSDTAPSLQNVKTIFKGIAGEDERGVKQQLQVFFLETLLNNVRTEIKPDGTEGFDYKRVNDAIKQLRGKDTGLGGLFDYVMEDLPGFETIFSDVSRLSRVFKDAEDFGASLSAAATASEMERQALTANIPGLMKNILKQKVFANIFTEPVLYDELVEVLAQDKFGKRSQKAIGRLMMKSALRLAKRPQYDVDALGEKIKVPIKPMYGPIRKRSLESLAEERRLDPDAPKGSRLEELFPGADMRMWETIPEFTQPRERPSLIPRAPLKQVPKQAASLNLPAPAPAPAQGGLGSLAALERVNLPLFG